MSAPVLLLHREEVKVFNSLDDEIKRDEDAASTRRERYVRYVAVIALAIVVFGGL